MEIKIGGTCMFRGVRVKIAAKYTSGTVNGYIVEVPTDGLPRWMAGSHAKEVLENCVPPLDLEKYYYFIRDVSGYEPPKKKKVYK